jgi:hypothetical protein
MITATTNLVTQGNSLPVNKVSETNYMFLLHSHVPVSMFPGTYLLVQFHSHLGFVTHLTLYTGEDIVPVTYFSSNNQ